MFMLHLKNTQPANCRPTLLVTSLVAVIWSGKQSSNLSQTIVYVTCVRQPFHFTQQT